MSDYNINTCGDPALVRAHQHLNAVNGRFNALQRLHGQTVCLLGNAIATLPTGADPLDDLPRLSKMIDARMSEGLLIIGNEHDAAEAEFDRLFAIWEVGLPPEDVRARAMGVAA